MFQFDHQKALQAVGILLEYERARRMNFMRLLKLLYVADREALLETGRTITGDRACAMKRGPVLSHIHDLIRGQSPRAGDWDGFVHTDRYEVELVRDPGRGELTRFEVAKLKEVSDRYRDFDEWAMSDETHKLEEWVKNYPGGDSANPIPWEDVFVVAGRPELAEAARRDEKARQLFDRVFGG